MADTGRLEDFLAFSSTLTGFTAFRLRGTGQVELYLSTLEDVLGEATVAELLDAYRRARSDASGDGDAFEGGIRREILSHEKFGPVARRLIKLWYVGTWHELSAEWRERWESTEKDRTFVVSPTAYTEGLLWPAVGANPSGAKPFGYGTWATPPRVESTEAP